MAKQLPIEIRKNHAGIENGWTVTGSCKWRVIAGWSCLVDDAGLIHQVGGHECDRHRPPHGTFTQAMAETWADNR
jgi:hypothetical protein